MNHKLKSGRKILTATSSSLHPLTSSTNSLYRLDFKTINVTISYMNRYILLGQSIHSTSFKRLLNNFFPGFSNWDAQRRLPMAYNMPDNKIPVDAV